MDEYSDDDGKILYAYLVSFVVFMNKVHLFVQILTHFRNKVTFRYRDNCVAPLVV